MPYKSLSFKDGEYSLSVSEALNNDKVSIEFDNGTEYYGWGEIYLNKHDLSVLTKWLQEQIETLEAE